MKFTETSNSFAIDCKLSSDQFPPFLHVDLPALNFELKQKYLEDEDFSASHRILSFSIPKQILNSDQQDVSFSIQFVESDRRGMSETLSSIRDKNLDPLYISLVHNSKALSPCEGLCKWLSSFEINLPVAPIIELIPVSESFDFKRLSTSGSLLDLNFNGVPVGSSDATFSLSTAINLSPFMPRNFSNLEFIKSPFPCFKTNLFVDKGNRQSELVLTTSINHILNNNSLKLDLILTLNDLELLTQTLLTGGAGGRKVYLIGARDSFLSSLILDPLSIDLTNHLKPRFRYGKKLYLADLLTLKKTTTTDTVKAPQFSTTVRHKVNLVTESSRTEIVFKGHLNFAESSSILNVPFIKVSWNELAFSIAPIARKKSSPFLELVTMKLHKSGSCNVYLAPAKNPILLLHEGSLDFRIEMKHKGSKTGEDLFLNTWKEFVRNLIVPDGEDFVPFLLKAQSSSASFITTATLPSASLVNQITSAALLKSTAASYELPENWANWFNSLAETTVKIAGMHGLTTQLLIEMPQMEICSTPKKFDSFSIDLRLEFTSLDLNICRRNQKSSKLKYY